MSKYNLFLCAMMVMAFLAMLSNIVAHLIMKSNTCSYQLNHGINLKIKVASHHCYAETVYDQPFMSKANVNDEKIVHIHLSSTTNFTLG